MRTIIVGCYSILLCHIALNFFSQKRTNACTHVFVTYDLLHGQEINMNLYHMSFTVNRVEGQANIFFRVETEG